MLIFFSGEFIFLWFIYVFDRGASLIKALYLWLWLVVILTTSLLFIGID